MNRWFVLLLLLGTLAARAQQPVEFRSDEGVMQDFRPTGVVWLAPDRLMVCDKRWNDFHTFDLTGRRYKLLSFPVRSRPLAGIDRDAEYNAALWRLTEEYAEAIA